MTSAQNAAFLSSSGISTTELVSFLMVILFVIVSCWAGILLIGKLKSIGQDKFSAHECIKHLMGVIRISVVLTIVLILIHWM